MCQKWTKRKNKKIDKKYGILEKWIEGRREKIGKG